MSLQPARLMGCNKKFSPEAHQFYQELEHSMTHTLDAL